MDAVISSWSGGKDSCFALYKAIHLGYKAKYLVNFISQETQRVRFHGIESRLIQLQADAIGIPLYQKDVGPDMEHYETAFKTAVSELKMKNIQKMVFGDIYLHDQKNWVERVCRDLQIHPVEPLWELDPKKIITEFINLGFKAVVVSARSELFDKSIIGKILDMELVDEIERRGSCPCGENGEFHTFVVDGPLFKNRIEIVQSTTVLKEGFWNHWFLDIQKYHINGTPRLYSRGFLQKN